MKHVHLLIGAILITGLAGAQTPVQWLDAQSSDLVATGLIDDARELPPSRHAESQPVSFAWRAEGGRSDEAPQTPAVESRQYWVDTTGARLERGVKLPLSAPGAVIRVSALEADAELELDPHRLELAVDDRPVRRSALEGLAAGDQMRREGMSVPAASLAFRLPADESAGTLRMRLEGAPADLPLVIHVHEPKSPWVARLATSSHNVLEGEPINFDVLLSDGEAEFAVEQVDAVLVDPGANAAGSLERVGERQLAGKVDSIAPGPGLYEAHVYVNHPVDGVMVRRDLKLAFSVAPPIGRFTGRAEPAASGDFGMALEVEVAAAGRYQVNGELHATNADGELVPVAFMQSAANLEPGVATIVLEADPGTLAGTSLRAPVEIRNLQLLDQGRMYLLESRERAIGIDAGAGKGPFARIER